MGSRIRPILPLVVAVALAATFAMQPVAAWAVEAYITTPLATGYPWQGEPQTDGAWLAYRRSTPLELNSYSDIVLTNLDAETTVTIGAGDNASQRNPDVSQGMVVYDQQKGSAHTVWSWSQGDGTRQLTATATADSEPRISGNLIAWVDHATGTVRYRDARAQGTVPGSANVTHMDVDRGRIFWSEAFVTQTVRVFEPGIDSMSKLVYTAPVGDDIDSVNAYGDYLAMTVKHGSHPSAVRVHTASTALMSVGAGRYPALFGTWMAYEAGNSGGDIRGGEPGPGGFPLLASSADSETAPTVYARRVVYQRLVEAFDADVYSVHISPIADRTEGPDRYKTAVATSKRYFERAENAVLCTGQNFPDALAAAPLARVLGGPLLLTKSSAVSSETIAELLRLGVKQVYLIGGETVISDDVRIQLVNAGIPNSKRVWGDDRYATSAQIALELAAHVTPDHPVRSAFYACGENFPDALALGPVAAGAMSPIMLVKHDQLPKSVSDVIYALDLDTYGIVAGGKDVVSDHVYNHIFGAHLSSTHMERWEGPDRYATATAVLEGGRKHHWVDLDTVGFATGTNFPDALGGGAALGHYGGALLLTKKASVPASVSSWVSANAYGIGRIDVFGGPDVVTDGVKNTIHSALAH